MGRQPDTFPEAANLSQTMIRVKDLEASVAFYRDILGMDVVRQMDFPDAQFSNYFLCNLTESQRAAQPAADGPEARAFTKDLWQMTLELTHNHGTQDDPSFAVHNGNDPPWDLDTLASLSMILRRCVRRWRPRGYRSTNAPRTAPCGALLLRSIPPAIGSN